MQKNKQIQRYSDRKVVKQTVRDRYWLGTCVYAPRFKGKWLRDCEAIYICITSYRTRDLHTDSGRSSGPEERGRKR